MSPESTMSIWGYIAPNMGTFGGEFPVYHVIEKSNLPIRITTSKDDITMITQCA
jgi:hypothetical protein